MRNFATLQEANVCCCIYSQPKRYRELPCLNFRKRWQRCFVVGIISSESISVNTANMIIELRV